MQLLLKSQWVDDCNGKTANDLFRGTMGHENEGIGSGEPENGRLPEILQNLLNSEASNDARAESVQARSYGHQKFRHVRTLGSPKRLFAPRCGSGRLI